MSNLLHVGYESVAQTRNGFDVARLVGIVVKRGPNLADAHVQRVLKIDKDAAAPYLVSELFASNSFAWLARQQHQNFCRLWTQLQREIELPQFTCCKIELEGTKTKDALGGNRGGHRAPVAFRAEFVWLRETLSDSSAVQSRVNTQKLSHSPAVSSVLTSKLT